jgi:putative two-component system response regulator
MASPVSARDSVHGRLRRLVVISVGLALGCSAVLDLWQEADRYLANKREGLLATANVVAAASSKAVAATDTPLILEGLRSIARVPGLVHAKVAAPDGQILAQIGGSVRLTGELDLNEAGDSSVWALLQTRTVRVEVPIIDGGRPVGRLSLVSESRDLAGRFVQVLLITAAGSALAIGIGLFIAGRLQRSITAPLVALAEDMTRIAETHDYSSSVEVTSRDETGALASSFNGMMAEIRKATVALVNREAEVIFRLSRATEQRDNETGAHIVRMAKLCRLVAEGLRLDGARTEALYRAAPLHDVGKIAVPDAIMFKAGRLDAEERREMEKHTSFGYEILRDSESDLIRLAAEMAWSHHERWDGTGYPRGLKGEAIPLPGRVASVADVCDALASERPYKPAWSLEAVQAHLIAESGTQFDPACVEALVSRWAEVQRLYAAGDDKHVAHGLQAA